MSPSSARRAILAPQSHAIHTPLPSTPASRSPQRPWSVKKVSRWVRRLTAASQSQHVRPCRPSGPELRRRHPDRPADPRQDERHQADGEIRRPDHDEHYVERQEEHDERERQSAPFLIRILLTRAATAKYEMTTVPSEAPGPTRSRSPHHDGLPFPVVADGDHKRGGALRGREGRVQAGQ